MNTHLFRLATAFIALAGSLCTPARGNMDEKPQEVPIKDNRWKQADNLTIKTLNNTKRTVDLPRIDGKDQFAYIRADNNKESFRITCKFIPKIHEETDVIMTVKAKWRLIDQKNTFPPKEKEQNWALPYETDLAAIQPDNAHGLTSTMFVEKKSAIDESIISKIMGKPHVGLIYEADLTMGVKTMTFNTHPGKIENDAFDVVDQVKGKVINQTPEFQDGKPSNSAIVIYPAQSKPSVKVKLQMISARLTPDQLQKLDWQPEAKEHAKEPGETTKAIENILPGLHLDTSRAFNKEIKDKILFLEGTFSPKEPLGKTMVKGKIDLDWKLKIGNDQIQMKKGARSKIDAAFRILRTKEIDQTAPGDTKIWPRGILIAVDALQKNPCSADHEYAKELTKNIYEKSVYPLPIVRQFHSQNISGSPAHYNIYLGRMIDMYYNNINQPKTSIICVEAAAMFRSCYNLSTNGMATAASAKKISGMGHQFGMLGNKVYDPTPVPKAKAEEQLSDKKIGSLTIEEYVEEMNKKAHPANQWSIKRRETTHKVSH